MKNNIHEAFKQSFQIFLSLYLFLMLLETFSEGFVSNYFDAGILLIFLTALGVALASGE